MTRARFSLKRLLLARPALILSPALFVVIVLAWDFATRYWQLPEFVLPTPQKIWRALAFGLSQDWSSVAGFWCALLERHFCFWAQASVRRDIGM